MTNRNSKLRVWARNHKDYDYGNNPIVFEECEDLGDVLIDGDPVYESKGVSGDRKKVLLKRIKGKLQNIMAHLLKLKYSTTGNEGTIIHWIDEIIHVFRPALIHAYDQFDKNKREYQLIPYLGEIYNNAIDEYENDMKDDESLISIERIIYDDEVPWLLDELLYEADISKLLSELPKSPKYNFIKEQGLPSKYQ